MKILVSFFLILLFISCSKIPAPSILAPSETQNLQLVSYGDVPNNYQKILKDYLIQNLKNYKTATVEFINEPAKLSIDHLGDSYSGYRVCLSINEQRGEYYIGYRNHFFLINNNKVQLHLYDSGLLTIPFEYCVTRDTTRELFIDEIPEITDDITVEKMDDIKIVKKETYRDISGNTFIICNFNNKQSTYVFNETKKMFKLINKLDEIDYEVNFNEAFIVATLSNVELSINRVNGKATLLKDSINDGKCELTDKTKF
tara:strand:+ start:333 stop:1103 length:771 start_codon:yes stop_codon:yes gene_type:complete